MKEIISYLIFGVFTTLINIVTFQLFISFSVNYELATVLAWIFSIIFAFITNKKYVFKSNNKNKKLLTKEILNFFGARVMSLGIDLLCMYICVDLILIDKLPAKIIANVIVVAFNYIISKFYIFKKKKDD